MQAAPETSQAMPFVVKKTWNQQTYNQVAENYDRWMQRGLVPFESTLPHLKSTQMYSFLVCLLAARDASEKDAILQFGREVIGITTETR